MKTVQVHLIIGTILDLVEKAVFLHISLTKLILSHDLLHSTVTSHIVFDQRDSNRSTRFEINIYFQTRWTAVARHWYLVFSGSQIGNLGYISFI